MSHYKGSEEIDSDTFADAAGELGSRYLYYRITYFQYEGSEEFADRCQWFEVDE